ncbi:MAG: signal peptide peptidase SppA [Planctomycetota bacterium]|jgi:protease-4
MRCVLFIGSIVGLGQAQAHQGRPSDGRLAAAKTDNAKPSKKPAAEKKADVAQITISGSYPEGPVAMGLFGDLQPSLSKVIRRLEQAGEDKEVDAVWLRIESLAVGRGKLHELRCAIARLRKTGKPVYAELGVADGSQYLLAAACDEIIMPPSGVLMVPGVRAEVTFYKGLLDKLGIQFDMIPMGKYKGAVEPFTRTNMSPPLRESLEAIVDDAYEDLATSIAAGRGMKDYRVKTLLDQGLFMAAAARKAGLVDQVVYADQFRESLPKKLKVDKVNLVADYKKKRVQADFSGITGMMKLMELFMGGKPSQPVSKKKRIAVVYAVGPIMTGKSVTDLFGSSTVGSTSMVAALRKAAEDPKVVAIVFRIDSPGGSAAASDLIWRETVRIEKPLIASMGDVAGSGGYYIAMGADKIIAEPGTITGSIGVVGGKVVLGGLYEKIGLTTETISRGQNSEAFSANQPFTPEERKVWTALLREIYRQFVSKAAQGRKKSYRELEKLAQGRVYTGRMAEANGLIDQLGTLRDAIAEAKKAAGLKDDEDVDLLILPRPRTIFEQLLGDPLASTGLTAGSPELQETLRQTQLLRRLFSEPTLMWMPYAVKLR